MHMTGIDTKLRTSTHFICKRDWQRSYCMPASQSEKITTVHKRRQTEQWNTVHEGDFLLTHFRLFGVENIHD